MVWRVDICGQLRAGAWSQRRGPPYSALHLIDYIEVYRIRPPRRSIENESGVLRTVSTTLPPTTTRSPRPGQVEP